MPIASFVALVLFQNAAPAPAAAAAPAAAPAAPPAPVPDSDYTVQPMPGLAWDLWAREPLVADPVAIAIDERGRVYAAESERQERGIEDNRSSAFWLMDDLQLQTVEDRLRMYEKWKEKREGGMDYYRRYADRVRLLQDPGPDGRPTRSTNFSGDMRQPLDGTGAGVITRDGDVWYTCIPSLWFFRDTTGSGTADVRKQLFTGFGVRTALRGHDMHGLAFGPDGRLYWSIGDRGYHVTLPDGTVLADPRSGAVFRCEPDGSGLEVFCRGLRNPQELAFNRLGDLFTGDNNSDGGDRARIVYCMEGGQTGWDMNYQTLEGSNLRGPWNQEHTWWTWDPADPVRPAWTLPPLAHVSSGPSGLAFYPGLGLSDRYRDHFFLCDFLGGDDYSRVLSFAVATRGAGYEVSDVHPFVEKVLPTDVDFGYDGRMYISDWSNGWYSDGTGQIFRVWDPAQVDSPRVQEVTRLFEGGFEGLPTDELGRLLGHPDMRVRLRAQWTLAARFPESTKVFLPIARADPESCEAIGFLASPVPLEARLHSIWGLGQQARAMRGLPPDAPQPANPAALLSTLLEDPEPEVRTQVARMLGDAGSREGLEGLRALLTDEQPRVRAAAAIAVGKLKDRDSIPALAAMLWQNDEEEKDPFLRHAASWALARIGDRDKLLEMAADPFPAVRMGALLALRELKDAGLVRLLFDRDPRVAAEAARAVHDLELPEAPAALVALGRRMLPEDAGTEAPPLTFTRDVWRKVPMADRVELWQWPGFSRRPTETQTIAELAVTDDQGPLYVERIGGLFVPTQTGDHVFSIASDDGASLLISPDESRDAARALAGVTGWVQPRDYDSQPGQTTRPIHMEAGRRYWLEVRHKQGGGSAFVSVRVRMPDGTMQDPVGRSTGDERQLPVLRRVVEGSLRDGSPAAAALLAQMARSSALPLTARMEALGALAEWLKPGKRDRVNGHVRTIDTSTRDAAGYRRVLAAQLPGLAQEGPSDLRTAARKLAAQEGITLDTAAALHTALDAAAPAEERAQCLQALARERHPELTKVLESCLASPSPRLRAAARDELLKLDAAAGLASLARVLEQGDLVEQQAAVAALGRLSATESDALLAALVARLEQGSLPAGLQLDLVEAVQARHLSALQTRVDAWIATQPSADATAAFATALEGGDAERGREIVNYHSAAACLRCHVVAGTGGHAAPSLEGVATRHDRRGLLQSLVEPNAVVAQGFGPVSAMPAMDKLLTPREIRDVVAYLSTLR